MRREGVKTYAQIAEQSPKIC